MTTNRAPSQFPMQHLRAWRLAHFLTQAALAQKSGVSEQTIVRLEHGGSFGKMATIRRLAQAFDVDPRVLAFGEPPTLVPENESARRS